MIWGHTGSLSFIEIVAQSKAGAIPIGKDYAFWVALFLSIIGTGILLLPFCNFIYQCGCRLPWQGAADYCNVNSSVAPHCPWCEPRPLLLMIIPFLTIFAAQGGTMYLLRKRKKTAIWALLIVATLLFLLTATLNGLVFKFLDDYPYFFVWQF